MDRRVKKSQKAIETALIGLMKEKNFEEITINSIAEKADVSRGTIYLNYEDKYEILDKCIDKELNKLVESCVSLEDKDNDLDAHTLLLRTLNYIEINSEVFITLLENSGVQSFRDKLLSLVKGRMFSQLNLTGINKGMNSEIFIHFWSVAVIGVIEWWVKNSMPYTSEEITRHLFSILSRNEVIYLPN